MEESKSITRFSFTASPLLPVVASPPLTLRSMEFVRGEKGSRDREIELAFLFGVVLLGVFLGEQREGISNDFRLERLLREVMCVDDDTLFESIDFADGENIVSE